MSHYTNIKTQLKDRQFLIEALIEMGWQLSQIEIHNVATNLYGFQGDMRKDIANIIIRRQHVGGASNDIGFLLEDDSYTAIISQFDKNHYNDTWMGKLKQEYVELMTEYKAKKKGMVVKKTTKTDGTRQLVLMKAK